MSVWQAWHDEQPRAVATLSTAFEGGRRHQAYILVARSADPARHLARAAAQALLCHNDAGVRGCGECAGCRKAISGNHPDLCTLEPNDKGNLVVAQVRECAARLALRAMEAETKVVLVLDADRMLPAAQNALLKTLEEPPGPTCFFLTTTRYRALLPTVRSRAQRVQLVPPRTTRAIERLAQAGVTPEIAPSLAALYGSDIEPAQAATGAGAVEILAALREVAEEADDDRLLALASDWSSDPERATLALALFEVEARDRWVAEHRHIDSAPGARPVVVRRLGRIADRLRHLRLMEPHHLNRTLSFEGLLREWAGIGTA